ncbi:MAG: 16S rRNA (cytosine(1402)-N(4))-methyltransferase [Candidatus Aminicenantes bacterium RBG_16_63_16]|nr:MAG: 16S rRNA (cytosine(1402)-N(4))-methyltransferase [Candidatus Aminicenantes bacterium RBG_16_63_16]
MSEKGHVPVLLHEVIEHLDAGREGLYIDATIGLGGHALSILESNPRARLVGFDIDELALDVVKQKLKPYAGRVELYHADFRLIPGLDLDFPAVRGLLLDLGLSSFQLDNPERGFSFNLDGPLDMRMDRRNKTTAFKIIDTYSEPKLVRLFLEYGELRQARRLAREIAARRKTRKISTTAELRAIIEAVCHWIPQKGKIHPAAKVFQALRIEVNGELAGLTDFLEVMAGKLGPGARLAAISFHSLEDRIVKRTFHKLAAGEERPPLLRLITRKPVTAAEAEVAANSRARSAKLRAAERV